MSAEQKRRENLQKLNASLRDMSAGFARVGAAAHAAGAALLVWSKVNKKTLEKISR